MEKDKTESELNSLQNFATQLGLTVSKVTHYRNSRPKIRYVAIKNSDEISPMLDYNQLNHFLLGYNAALNK